MGPSDREALARTVGRFYIADNKPSAGCFRFRKADGFRLILNLIS